MESLQIVLLICYFLVLFVLSIYGFHRYYLSFLFYRHRPKSPKQVTPFESLKEIPWVTVQLPIFNEKYVAERLIRSVCLLDYPKGRLEIQVLDDSTDDTTEIAEESVRRFKKQGFHIECLHRDSRQGFKAGALEEGLHVAKGEFIAVFDADFVPEKDFLKKLVPYLVDNARLGMVQARWGHINRDFSLLTQAQSIFLDGHFVIEHAARNRSGKFFNFNGTAGMWRKTCILAAGGWQHDTLTEDLDLSYRAQLAGWKFLFLPDVVAPAELPVEANAFKSQQHRWAKGSIQTARKLLPKIVKSKLPFGVKLEAIFHLTNNLAYLLMVILSLLMPLSIFVRNQMGISQSLIIDLPFFMSATFSVTFFYCCSQREIYPNWRSRLKYIPFNLALGIGLSVNNAKAVLEALFKQQSEFSRTPKYAILRKGDSWKHKNYKKKYDAICLIELSLAFYYSLAIYYAIVWDMYVSLPFLMLFFVGYLYISILSVLQSHRFRFLVPSFRN